MRAELSCEIAVRRQLLVLLHHRRLRAGGGAAVFPIRLIHEPADAGHFLFAEDFGNADQHQYVTFMENWIVRPGAICANGAALW